MYRIEDQHYTRVLTFLEEAQQRLRNLHHKFIHYPPKDDNLEDYRLLQNAMTSVDMAKTSLLYADDAHVIRQD